MSKISNLSVSEVFFQALNTPKLVFGQSSTPDPAAETCDIPRILLVGWGRGPPSHTLPIYLATLVR